ncbi:hypothetical protein JL49_13450 [Pseudoalteromonas luteoviolacea]|nr:hypothetical protein JL49_13450 [Pseudoalteromonas luteoviolacea]
MQLIDWVARNEVSLSELAEHLGKSFYTVRSYVYGHRKVPLEVGVKIGEYTNGEVTQKDLDGKHREFSCKAEKIGIVRINGGKCSPPIASIYSSSGESEKANFLELIKTVVMNDNNATLDSANE